jgi:hypothetical protein
MNRGLSGPVFSFVPPGLEVHDREVGEHDHAVTANTYTHVLTDETELIYEALLDR